MNAISAVIFDLGGTLIDFAPMDPRSVFREGAQNAYDFLREQGCALPPFEKFCRTNYRAMRWAWFKAKLGKREVNSLSLLRELARKLRIQDNERVLSDLGWLWYLPMMQRSRIDPDAIATLSELRARGIKLALLSNTVILGDVHDKQLREIGLYEFFPVRVYSSEFGYRKPDRRIFMHTLDHLNADARSTLFVGDTMKTDIIGAKNCGMRTALKQANSSSNGHAAADHVIRKLSDVLDLTGLPVA
jgi:HAD superfamily hydrolase (TIGR01662 family)